MKIGVLFRLLVPAAVVSISSPALATDRAACLDAASKAQTFRDLHKLVEAREKLRVCASAQCPTVVQTDCATWLAEVEQGLPTVVVTATDGAGRDRFDVKVTVDGQGPATALQGQALTMNPGPHTLHLEAADGATRDQQVLVKEGMKNQGVAVAIGTGKAGEGSEASQPAGASAPSSSSAEHAGGEAAAKDGSVATDGPWRTVGWVTAGVGLAGVVVGGVFGVKAIADKNGAHCDSSNACDPGGLSDANSAATISTIGVVAGGVLLVGGVALVLLAPKRDSRVALTLTPRVGVRDAGLVLGGTW